MRVISMGAPRGPETITTARLGVYLIESRESGALLGSTGLLFGAPYRAMTGYVLAKDAWGRSYATEALRTMVETAGPLGVRRLYALCHHEHRASARVLENAGFPSKDASARTRSSRTSGPPNWRMCSAMRFSSENKAGTEEKYRS